MYRKCAAVYPAKVSKVQGTLGQWLPEKQCGRRAKKGGIYCGAHDNGGRAGTGTGGHAPGSENLNKLQAGLRRFYEVRKKLKAEGVIDAIKPGEFQKGNKAASRKNKMLAAAKKGIVPPQNSLPTTAVPKALKLLEAEKRSLPAVPDKPFEELEDHEKLTTLTGISLNMTHTILSMPIDLNQPTLFKEQMKLLSGTLSLRVKVDRNMLQARKQDKLAEIVERLRAEPKTIEN